MASRTDPGKKRPLEEASESPPSQRPKLGMGKDSAQKERSNSLLSSDLAFDEANGKVVDVKVEVTSSSTAASLAAASSSQASSKASRTGRLRPRTKQQIVNELYIGLVQEMTFNEEHLPSNLRKVPWDRRTALGVLLNPMRVPTVMERWCPYEVALFEAAILLYGKNFSLIQEAVKTKTVREVIGFYYEWKKTPHYDQWKKSYVEDERELPGAE